MRQLHSVRVTSFAENIIVDQNGNTSYKNGNKSYNNAKLNNANYKHW